VLKIDHLYQLAYKIAYRLLTILLIFWHPHTRGAFVAFWHGQKLLLVRHSYKPGLCLPGGGVEKNEEYDEAATRELREETGISVDTVALSKPIEFHLTNEGKKDYICCFEVEHQDSMVELTIDNREIVWAGFKDPALVQLEDCNTLLREYLNYAVHSSRHS